MSAYISLSNSSQDSDPEPDLTVGQSASWFNAVEATESKIKRMGDHLQHLQAQLRQSMAQTDANEGECSRALLASIQAQMNALAIEKTTLQQRLTAIERELVALDAAARRQRHRAAAALSSSPPGALHNQKPAPPAAAHSAGGI